MAEPISKRRHSGEISRRLSFAAVARVRRMPGHMSYRDGRFWNEISRWRHEIRDIGSVSPAGSPLSRRVYRLPCEIFTLSVQRNRRQLKITYHTSGILEGTLFGSPERRHEGQHRDPELQSCAPRDLRGGGVASDHTRPADERHDQQ